MADAFNVWPGGVPKAYGDVSFPAPEERHNIAISGLDLLSDFYVAFYLGFAFIAVFSITRFNQRIDEGPEAVGHPAVLSQLPPMEMRDRRLILQAYAIYVTILLLLYGLLTFYGKVILTWINTTLPSAGFTTDTSGFDFQSPNWPLFVALSMIGVLPVLKPVDALERRLRRWTHAIVGIPVHIFSNARALRDKLREQLRRASKGAKATSSGAFYNQIVPEWIRNVAVDKAGVDYAFEAHEQLGTLAAWVKYGRGKWPTEDRSSEYEQLLAKTIDDGFVLMGEFDDLVQNKHIDKAPAAPDNSALSKEQVKINHQNRLEREWQNLSLAVVEMRDTLLCLLSIGAEKQRNYKLIDDKALRTVMSRAIPLSGEQRGPQAAIALSLIPVFVIYVAAVSLNYQSEAGTFGSSTFSTSAISGLIETIKFASLFLFPLVVVLNYRNVRVKLKSWTRLKPFDLSQRSMAQLLWAAILAYAVAALCLSLLAVAQIYLVARSPASAAYNLLEGDLPQLFLNLGLATIAVPYSIGVMYAVDIKKHASHNEGTSARLWMAFQLLCVGAAAVCVTFLIQATHLYFWYEQFLPSWRFENGAPPLLYGDLVSWLGNLFSWVPWFQDSCTGEKQRFLFDWFGLMTVENRENFLICSRIYDVTSFLIYGATSLLAVTLYLPEAPQADGPADQP